MVEKCKKTLDLVILSCLYLMIFCLPFTKAGQETFTWMAISLWMIKKLFNYGIKETKNSLPQAELNKAILIFIMVNALSTVTSVDFHLSLRAFFGKICKFAFLFFIATETINNRKRLRNILIIMFISAVLIVTDAMVQYFRGTDFLRGFPYEYLRASFPSANGFGGWLIVVIPTFLGVLITSEFGRNKIKRIGLTGLLILLLICLILTHSRAAWLSFLLGLGLMCYWVIRSLSCRMKKLFYLLIIFCLVSTSLFFLPQTIKDELDRMNRIGGAGFKRTRLWKESCNIIKDFPLFGCGLNTYSVVVRNYRISGGGGIYPHNSYLQMAAETGFLGLASFLWILVTLFKSGFRVLNAKNNPLLLGILSGILAFLVQSFFDTHLFALQMVVLLWFMMGLAIAVIRIGPLGVDES